MAEEFLYTPLPVPSEIELLPGWLDYEFQRIGAALGQKVGMLGFDGCWDDYVGDLNGSRASGATQPNWAVFRGGLYGHEFSASSMNEVWINLHIKHDYKQGTKIYPHVHWSTNNATPSGTVRWGIEYSIAKGFDQQAFPATTTVYVEQAASAQYQHMITEVSDADAIAPTNTEVDSIIMIRLFRDAAHANDTATYTSFGLYVDLHYQKERIGTPNKAPDFYKGPGVR